MSVIRFLRSRLGRVLRIAAGVALIAYGTTHPSQMGLVLMLVGIVPLVTGIAGICLFEELARVRTRRTRSALGGRHVRSDCR